MSKLYRAIFSGLVASYWTPASGWSLVAAVNRCGHTAAGLRIVYGQMCGCRTALERDTDLLSPFLFQILDVAPFVEGCFILSIKGTEIVKTTGVGCGYFYPPRFRKRAKKITQKVFHKYMPVVVKNLTFEQPKIAPITFIQPDFDPRQA